MLRTSRRFWLGIAVLLAVSTALPAQQAPPQPPPERVIINFILPIDANSVNLLLNVVNLQVRNGTKKITIVLSSGGGDPAAAFAAYNILKNMNAEITTFNVGNVDSAAILIYCAGKYRYSLPSPSRFLIHSTSLNPITTSLQIEPSFMESQLLQIKSLNQIIVQVIKANSNKTQSEIENAVHGQIILSPDEAKEWGIVQEIRPNFMEPGAVFVTVNGQAGQDQPAKPLPYTTEKPSVSSGQTNTQVQ